MTECNKEWVRQELVRWDEGLADKFASMQTEIDELKRRLAHLESHLSSSDPPV